MIKKFMIAIIASISILGVSCAGGSSSSDTVANVSEEQEELKIASGTVAATQVMDELGIDLVGVPQTSTELPERYKGLTEIGQAFSPNFEVIVSLESDLLVLDNNFQEKLDEQVKEYGINPFYFNTSTFNNFKESITELGKLTDKDSEAKELVDELQESVDGVLEKGKNNKEDIKVAIVFGTAESYMLATDKSYVGDLLDTIGVSNVTDDLSVDSAYVDFSMEQVVDMNPDYVLRLAHGDIEASKDAFEKEFAQNPAWMSLDATNEGRVYDLDPSIFGVSANLSVKDAIVELGNILYGE
ncbi:MAG: ABC transporter substrate-binding protein [Clostridium perfringens]|nr:ABC transporter substrate-binding protein [Clostridium perfringens]